MIGVNVRSTYKSNVSSLSRDLDAKLERIVERAARDGSSFVRANSRPPVAASATDSETSNGHIRVGVFVARTQFWAIMFDKGTLGKRTVPLEQPGRREKSWPVHRRSSRRIVEGVLSGARGTEYTAYRQAQALLGGGIEPQYFLIGGKRHAEEMLAAYLNDGL